MHGVAKPENFPVRPMLDVRQQLNEMTVYVKTIASEGRAPVYWIFGSEGTAISGFVDRDVAFACSRQHDLIPHSLH